MMMLKRVILFSLSLLFFACAPKHGDIVLSEYNGQEIKMAEFEKAYSKNAGGFQNAKDDSLSQLKNFLNLYTNFKMKLLDADVRGYGSVPELNAELLDYRQKVGVTFILDRQLVEPALRKLYDMRLWEYRVSHLMIRPDSTGDLAAKEKTEGLLARIKAGEKFEELVAEYSTDNFSKKSGGDIFYITAGQIIPEFEDAVYKTKVGDIYPDVVKTRFGYHIIKVTDIKPRIPQIRASHILVDFYDEDGQMDSSSARARIDSIATMLKNGADFAELATQYSEDQGSKINGGDLNYFERRMMIKEFDEVAFSLEVGQISDIVTTPYGFHIIKLTDKKPQPTIEEEKENLKKIYKQTRYNDDLLKLHNHLREKYGYKLNESLYKFISKQDTTRINATYWKSDWRESVKDSTLFTLGGANYSLDTVVARVENVFEFNNQPFNDFQVTNFVAKVSGDAALDLEALNLDKSNEEFKDLMDDYKSGIYIFKLQDEEVWGKINIDSLKLVAHYEKTKEKYKWGDRVELAEIFSKNDSLIKVYKSWLDAGENFDSIAAKYTERPGFKEKAGKFAMLDINSSQQATVANKLTKPGDYSAPFEVTGGKAIVMLIKKDAARLKTFDEARAEVSGSFQEEESKRLEQDYLSRLQSLYNPKFYYDELEKAFKEN